MLVDIERRLWTVKEYYAMAEVGILREDERLELIAGDVLKMSSIGVRHAACVNLLNELFVYRFRGRAIVSVQHPVRLNNQSEPVPDIGLLRYRDDFYAHQMPTGDNVLLLVEAADSTIPYDRWLKRPLYARAGIPEYWLVNLVDNAIEVHRQPENGVYTELFTRYREEMIAAVAFPEDEFKVGDLIS
jgi:Uma2 family endonuclease